MRRTLVMRRMILRLGHSAYKVTTDCKQQRATTEKWTGGTSASVNFPGLSLLLLRFFSFRHVSKRASTPSGVAFTLIGLRNNRLLKQRLLGLAGDGHRASMVRSARKRKHAEPQEW